jgi:hypothetical protein
MNVKDNVRVDITEMVAVMNGWTVIPTYNFRRLNRPMTIIDSW